MVSRKRVRSRIVDRFDTQRNFASKLGVDAATVSRQLRGHRPILDGEKIRWAELLGCDVGELFNA